MKRRRARGLQPLLPVLRYQHVRDQIRNFIFDHGLRAGNPLPSENDLARQLGVGRNAVREGIRSLEAQGLVEVRHGTGTFVRQVVLDDLLTAFGYMLFDGDSLNELYQIRQRLEEDFLPLALSKLPPATVPELRRLLDRMEACKSWGQEYLDCDMRLHRTIFANVGNRTLLKLLDIFGAIYQRAHSILRKNPASARRFDLAAHRALVEAIARQDSGAALRALRRTWAGLPALALETRIHSVANDRGRKERRTRRESSLRGIRRRVKTKTPDRGG